jgi:hypothetical protein
VAAAEHALFDHERSPGVLGVEQEDAAWSDEHVVEVPVRGAQVVPREPAFGAQPAQLFRGLPFPLAALPPALHERGRLIPYPGCHPNDQAEHEPRPEPAVGREQPHRKGERSHCDDDEGEWQADLLSPRPPRRLEDQIGRAACAVNALHKQRVHRGPARGNSSLIFVPPRSDRGDARPDNASVIGVPDARTVVAELLGKTVETVTGRCNVVLALEGDNVLVGTARTAAGAPVPLAMVQAGLERLYGEGGVDVDVETLGHRSAFVAAVLRSLPGTSLEAGTPARIVLAEGVPERYRREAAGEINAWWEGDERERFWLEITDRPDIGVDLHAPQRDAGRRRTSGYSLLWWVERGDVVFHYDLNARAISTWSYAVGKVSEAPVVWLSHRSATRRRLVNPRAQPGWWLDLDGPYPLPTPLTLARLREQSDIVRAVRDELGRRHRRPLYFPFFFYRDRDLRPMQPYLNKLPAALVAAVPELAAATAVPRPVTAAAAAATPAPRPASQPGPLGVPYRRARARHLPDEREPFSVDPAIVERGVAGHVDSQNAVADALAAAGIVPRSPRPEEPNFDLAWERNGFVHVAEVKSITDQNEEQQLRLGLGQLLRYRSLLRRRYGAAAAVLVAEREPRDSSWRGLCSELGITLVTPADLTELLE